MNIDTVWKRWQEQEARSRLAYSWVTIDLELSLFHDTPPKLAITDLNTVLPDPDLLWQSKSGGEWLMLYSQLHRLSEESGSSKHRSSLSMLYRQFMDGETLHEDVTFTAKQLQLLLHPLQALASHLYQCLGSFFDGGSHHQINNLTATLASRALLQEVQRLLQQWYALSMRSQCNNPDAHNDTKMGPVTGRSLLLYHLMTLQTMVPFSEIERLARRERSATCRNFFQPTSTPSDLRGRVSEESVHILFHCGQVLRLATRKVRKAERPSWWAAAIYRAAVIMWTTSMANAGSSSSSSTTAMAWESSIEADHRRAEGVITIDEVAPEDEAVQRYLLRREGVPMLSKHNGMLVSLDVPGVILSHCVEVLMEDGPTTRLTEGIAGKLERLRVRWES